jgi:alkaline phosphatase D
LPAPTAAFCQLRGDLAQATTPLRGYPFTLGVASGDPELRGAVLWTRLAPDIYLPDGGMPARRLPVQWRLAKDPGMRRVVRRGVTLAVPELAHSVHVEVSGLDLRKDDWLMVEIAVKIVKLQQALGTTPTATPDIPRHRRV